MTFYQYLTLLIFTPISLGAVWFLIKIIIGAVREAREEIKGLEIETKDVWNRKESVHSDFLVHPATCDCSGKEKCERINKISEGEMKCVAGQFVCPCGIYIQHKCGNP